MRTSPLVLAVLLVLGPPPALARNQSELPSTANCERVETNGSTCGKCDSICKGKEVTRDAGGGT